MSFYPLLQHCNTATLQHCNTATLARMNREIGQTVPNIFQPWHLATGFYWPLLKRKVGSSSPPRGVSSIQIGRRDSVVQVRCPGEGLFRQPEMRDGEGAVQAGDAGERRQQFRRWTSTPGRRTGRPYLSSAGAGPLDSRKRTHLGPEGSGTDTPNQIG